MTAPRLVEREPLLDELEHALADAARGHGRMVLLRGAAGVGKSAVARALGERAAPGVRRLTGYCDAMATPQALGPLLDMLPQSPRLAAAAGGTRHELFSALVHELTHGQTLAVIEDVHWADAATADLLLHLGRRIAGTRSLVVVTCRDEDLGPEHPVRLAFEALATERAIARRTLEPLSIDGVAALAAGRQIDVQQLHDRTGGNPFFVTEVLAAPGWAVPPTVADAVRARARRLPSGARDVLDTMAVEPRPVRLEHLLELGHAGADVDAAVGSGMLVHAGGRIAFRHDLARLGILEGLPPAARAARHRAWLALLQPIAVRPEHAARVAAHALGAHARAEIIAWSRRAAHHASHNGTHHEAAAHLEAALGDDALEPAVRAELLAALAQELGLIDRRSDAVRACEEALALRRALGDRAAATVVLADLARAQWGLGDGTAARSSVAEAVTAAEWLRHHSSGAAAERAIAYAHAWAGYLAMLGREHRAAMRLTATAARIAREHGLDDILVIALNALGSTMIVGEQDAGGAAALQESRELAARIGQEGDVAHALVNLGSGLGEIRQYSLAVRWLEEAIAFTTARDLDAPRHYCTAWLARVRFEQGRWPEAEALVTGLELSEGSSPVSAIVGRSVLGRLRARRGEPAGEELDEAWRLALRTDDLQRLWPVAAARAECAWLTGERLGAAVADALAVAARARELELAWARDELAWWIARLGGDAPAAPETGQDSTGQDSTGQASTAHLARRTSTPFALQLSGQHAAAAQAWGDLGCPYERASALADCGDEPSLREALAILQPLGAAPLAARVRRRLRALGATAVPLGPRATATTHPSGLTDRQVEVLELVAAGLTDRQIGERLFLSAKTVGHHVSAILEGLGVDGRTAAARAAFERGWVTKMGNPPQVPTAAAP